MFPLGDERGEKVQKQQLATEELCGMTLGALRVLGRWPLLRASPPRSPCPGWEQCWQGTGGTGRCLSIWALGQPIRAAVSRQAASPIPRCVPSADGEGQAPSPATAIPSSGGPSW